LVRLICRPPVAEVGIVITTGDQLEPALEFNEVHVAVELAKTEPHV
jgi:hypothetical protein